MTTNNKVCLMYDESTYANDDIPSEYQFPHMGCQ